jgi:hypothetical protein
MACEQCIKGGRARVLSTSRKSTCYPQCSYVCNEPVIQSYQDGIGMKIDTGIVTKIGRSHVTMGSSENVSIIVSSVINNSSGRWLAIEARNPDAAEA